MTDRQYEFFTMQQLQLKNAQRELEEFRSGERYLKLQEDHRCVMAGYRREISNLKKEVAEAHAETINVRNIWFEECDYIRTEYEKEIEKLNSKIHRQQDEYWEMAKKYEQDRAELVERYEGIIAEKDAVIRALTDELEHAIALLGRDSTNTSLPTSQTPLGKEKHIPNGREKTGRKKGGQPGHEQHVLEAPSEQEATDTQGHTIEEGTYCPRCKSENFVYTGQYIKKYVIDVEIKVKKILHKYYLYQCENCGEIISCDIEPSHKMPCQYGANIQAIALSLMNSMNVTINKVPLFLSGITGEEVKPSEGYIAKLQWRAANHLREFMEDLKKVLLCLRVIYWDDTVLMANKERICLRFYGDERVAYYVVHEKKDLNGMLEDGILENLSSTVKVMHDHNIVNYNDRFSYQNLECNSHLQRDNQKNLDDTQHTEWGELKELIAEAIKEKKEQKKKGKTAFELEYIEEFDRKLQTILKQVEEKAEENQSRYSGPPERALVKRIQEYKEEYFAWMKDFSLPTTNNLSERSLRGAKSKQKASGQFTSVETANNYAVIRTYIETCRRNGMNEITALSRLCSGNPVTVSELFSEGKNM